MLAGSSTDLPAQNKAGATALQKLLPWQADGDAQQPGHALVAEIHRLAEHHGATAFNHGNAILTAELRGGSG